MALCVGAGPPGARPFARKVEVEVDKDRGSWIEPRKSQTPLRDWVETFLAFSTSRAPTTQQTYRRYLELYVPPPLGHRRLAPLHAEEIERWLVDELAAGGGR